MRSRAAKNAARSKKRYSEGAEQCKELGMLRETQPTARACA